MSWLRSPLIPKQPEERIAERLPPSSPYQTPVSELPPSQRPDIYHGDGGGSSSPRPKQKPKAKKPEPTPEPEVTQIEAPATKTPVQIAEEKIEGKQATVPKIPQNQYERLAYEPTKVAPDDKTFEERLFTPFSTARAYIGQAGKAQTLPTSIAFKFAGKLIPQAEPVTTRLMRIEQQRQEFMTGLITGAVLAVPEIAVTPLALTYMAREPQATVSGIVKEATTRPALFAGEIIGSSLVMSKIIPGAKQKNKVVTTVETGDIYVVPKQKLGFGTAKIGVETPKKIGFGTTKIVEKKVSMFIRFEDVGGRYVVSDVAYTIPKEQIGLSRFITTKSFAALPEEQVYRSVGIGKAITKQGVKQSMVESSAQRISQIKYAKPIKKTFVFKTDGEPLIADYDIIGTKAYNTITTSATSDSRLLSSGRVRVNILEPPSAKFEPFKVRKGTESMAQSAAESIDVITKEVAKDVAKTYKPSIQPVKPITSSITTPIRMSFPSTESVTNISFPSLRTYPTSKASYPKSLPSGPLSSYKMSKEEKETNKLFSGQNIVTKQTTKSGNIRRQGPRSSGKIYGPTTTSTPKQTPITGQPQIPRLINPQRPKLKQPTLQKTHLATPFSHGPTTPTPTTLITAGPSYPFIPPRLISPRTLINKPKKSKKGRKYKYTPSLFAIVFKRTAAKKPKILTGFGIRPVIRKSRK